MFADKKAEVKYDMVHMELEDQTDDCWQHIEEVVDKKTPLESTVTVVANQAGYEHTFEHSTGSLQTEPRHLWQTDNRKL